MATPPNLGQWAINGREPLNPNERFKAADDGLNVRQRIETIYSQQGFASIPADDLRGRMRWWGLYTQRRPGIDGGRTASLAPEELDDEFFMLRVRCDGGLLSSAQTRTIATISTEFARGTADVSDRQNIQLHWVAIEDVPEIWRRLEAVGLSTTEACGDTPRVILGSPVAGVAADEIVDGTPAIAEIKRRFIGNPEFSNLPRKFKTAISGSPRLDVAHEINDVSFVGVVHPQHGPGFDVWVGGGLSTAPHFARRLGAWVPVTEVADVWAGVIGIFRDYGYRKLRTKARLKFLMADWGPERFREVLESEYLNRRLVDGPAPIAVDPGERDHVGIHPQSDGRVYVGAAPTVGRLSGELLARLAELTDEFGDGNLRLTAQQKLVLVNVEPDRAAELSRRLDELGLQVHPSRFRRSTMACTGIEYCKLAIVETKATAAATVAELERRLPTFDAPLAIHVNGCPNSCARIQVADIGLKGMIVSDSTGASVAGYQVHLGGMIGEDALLGRKLRQHKVTAAELPDYVERIARNYLTDTQTPSDPTGADVQDPDRASPKARPSFAAWAAGADEELLR